MSGSPLLASTELSLASVTGFGCVVRDQSRRNVVERVETEAGGYVIKCPASSAEVVSAWRLASARRFRRLAPEFIATPAGPEILTTRLLEGGMPFGARRGDRPDAGANFEVGRAISWLHRFPSLGVGPSPIPAPFHDPWPSTRDLVEMSWATRTVAEVIQGSPALSDVPRQVFSTWTQEVAIHGDLRDDNILLVPGPKPRVVFVDWETFGVGDPAWDVGCFLGERIAWWIWRLGEVETESLSSPHHGVSLNELQSDVGAFLDGYGSPNSDFMDRATAFSAARLIQRSIETSAVTDKISRSCVLMLQVAANILEDPAAARRELLAAE